MTDGPYDNSIRSNSPSGLGGIFAQLQAIANGLAALPQIAADVGAIRVLAERLIGTSEAPTGWTGLPSAWGVDTSTTPAALATRLFQLRDILALLQTSVGTGMGANVVTIRNRLNTDFPTFLQADGLLIAQSDLQNSLTTEIRDVLGLITQDPVGSTLKDLLRSIDANVLRSAECCEEGQNSNEFPPPTSNCGSEVTTWTECSLELRFSEVEGNDVYAVVFPASITSIETFVGVPSAYDGPDPDPGLVPQLQAPGNALTLSACIAWNFGALSELIDYAVGTPFYDNATPFNSYTSTSEPPLQEGVQLVSWNARTDAGVIRVLQANFGFPNGVTPVGKVYVGLPQAPS